MPALRLEKKWRVALVAALGLFMAVLDNTIVSVALPQMQQAFHTDLATITWVATGYFLAQAAVIPIAGYLSDRLGSRLVFLVSLLLFTIGSVLCAFAPSEQWLIVFRLFQGVGAGGIFPVAFALVFRAFPPAERGPASAVISFPVLLAPAFGPTIGGYLTTTFNWSAIFIINLPVGIVALLLAFFVLPDDRQQSSAQVQRGFDVPGLLLAMLSSSALVYGISEASSRGWGDGLVLGSLVAGVVLLVIFILLELRSSDPVLDVRLFLNYTFAASNILTWVVSGLLFGSLFLLPFFFENIQKQAPLAAGEYLIAQGLASAVAVVAAGSLYNRIGPRILVCVGFLLLAGGTYGLTQLSVSTSGLSLQWWLIARGLGLGLCNIPLQTLALSVVSNAAMARASSLLSVTRLLFGAVGVSLLTTYLTQQASSYGTEAAQALRSRTTNGIVQACIPVLRQGVGAVQACVKQHALVLGMNDTFTLIMFGSAAAILLAIFLGRDPALTVTRGVKGEQTTSTPPAIVLE